MDATSFHPVGKPRLIDRSRLWITAVDPGTLGQCSEHDWQNVRAIADIMIFTWLYQTALFSIIAHRLFAAPGQIRPELLLASMFLASFILLIDSYMVMRSGWHLSGIAELKRGGIDISGGIGPRAKAAFFLAIRIFLSIGIAQLTAIFLSLLIFNSDISARVHDAYLRANAPIISNATALVDGEIRRAADGVKAESDREAALAAEVDLLRQQQIDPSAGDPQIQLAQQDVARLMSQKADADQAVQKAEEFASNELGGIEGPGNSGIPGDGPRRKAAMESVANARNQDQQVSADLEAARSRFDSLRTEGLSTSQATRQQSHDQFPAFASALADEEARLSAMKDRLANLIRTRDDAIRIAVEAAPGRVPVDDGLLTEINALDHIAHENPKIAAVIILVDLTSFGFELAAVLAKVTSYVPTTYAALLARDAYMGAVRIVDKMMAELDRGPPAPQPAPEFSQPAMPPIDPPSPINAEDDTDPFVNAASSPIPAARRPRGRPRKTPPNGGDNFPVPPRPGGSVVPFQGISGPKD